MKLEIMLEDGALMPDRAHADDAGLDLLTPIVERDGFNFIIREQLADLLETLGDKYEIN